MKAVFVFPSSSAYGVNETTEQPPLGMGYLASVLEKDGFDCEIIDANFLGLTAAKTAEMIKKKAPDAVCLSLYAFNFKGGLALSEILKRSMPEALVLAGGAQPSALAERTLEKTPFIDAAIAGEGEMTLLEIMRRMRDRLDPFDGVSGAIYRTGGGEIVKNSPRRRIEDLDALPFPAFHLYPRLSGYHRRAIASPAIPVLTSRGCPFECIFCSKSVFSRRVYYRSAENVIAEIDYLVGAFGARQLDVVDDNFITKKERAVAILEALCKKPYRLAINLQSGVSATLVDRDMLRLMKAAGVYRIAFGIESGNQGVLDTIKKAQRLEDVARAVKLAKEAGMRTDGFFMIGLPGESPKTMQETIDFAKKTDPHTANFHMVMPFPSTELYDMLKRSGRFLKTTDDGTESGYNYPEAFYEIGDLKKEDIERYYKKAYREFYFRPKKIIGTLFDIRSLEELLWVFKTGWLVVMSLFRKRAASLKSRFRLPRKGHYSRGWGDAELDLLARLVYHPLYGLFYRHRYRMVFSWVPESTSLLEVGCGYGLFLPSLGKKTKRLYAMDIHPHLARVRDVMKKEGVGQIFLSRGDMVRLPYADESFDTIVCMSVLEHITPIDGAAEELARVLKKGGRLIAAFPTKNAVTRILFRLVNRKDDEIHPNSHASILEALSRRLSFQRKKVFPAFLPVDLGLYCIGEYVK